MEKTKMGRKPKDGVVREVKVSLKLSEEEIKKVIELAEYLNIPRTALMRNFILTGLDDAKILRNIGILDLTKNLSITSEFVKEFKRMKPKTLQLS